MAQIGAGAAPGPLTLTTAGGPNIHARNSSTRSKKTTAKLGETWLTLSVFVSRSLGGGIKR